MSVGSLQLHSGDGLGSTAPSRSTAASALLAHKQWKHQDLMAQFLSPDYDEARYMATTMAQSSSTSLDQLSSLLAEISSEIHSVIVTHHSSLLSINSHILLIEGEVQLVVRRIASLKAALARIQNALIGPYEKLSTAVQQLQTVQNTSEYIRQSIRVLNFCEKLRALTVTPAAAAAAATAPSPAANTATSTTAATRVAPPPLRGLVKSASLLYDVHEVFDLINLNGVAAVDAQLPFLNQISDMLHNQGRKALFDAMRTDQTTPGGQVNQVDLDYVLQLFYNMAPSPNAAAQLRIIDAQSQMRGASAKSAAAAAANPLPPVTGGMELAIVLDELTQSYLEQLRAALKKMLDVAASNSLLLASSTGLDKKKGVGVGVGGLLSGASFKKSLAASPAPAAAPATPASLRSTLWDRLESFTDLLSNLAIQVWTIARIMTEKKDLVWNPSPGVTFQQVWRIQQAALQQRRQAEQVGPDGKLLATKPNLNVPPSLLHKFWLDVCDLIRSEVEPLSIQSVSVGVGGGHSSSNFLRTIFVNEYPRLHTLFEKGVYERVVKWAKMNSHHAAAGHAANNNATGGITNNNNTHADSNTIGAEHRHILLSSFLPFFQLYLSRTLNLLMEPLNLMFTSHESLNALPTVPSKNDIGSFLNVLHGILDSLADTQDEEVNGHVLKSVAKSIQMFTTHVERMMVVSPIGAGDKDIFASSLLALADVPSASSASSSLTGGSSSLGLRSVGVGHNNNLSQAQRTNLDLFAITCQVQRELLIGERTKKHPTLANSQAANIQIAKCVDALRTMQESLLKVLLHNVTYGLTSCFYTIVPDDDLQAITTSVEGSQGVQAFRRRLQYTTTIIIPAYLQHVQGGNTLHADDAQMRLTMWSDHFMKPLYQQLSTTFLHILSLRPLASSSSPAVLNDALRSSILTDLTLFDAQMQSIQKGTRKAARTTAGDFESSLPGFKAALFAGDMNELAMLYANRAIDQVTMLHFLFTTVSLTPTNNSDATPLAHTAPHRLLQMKVEEYSKFIESHNMSEIIELFNKVYTNLESRIPRIPAGAAGRQYVQDTYPKLGLALKIITKTSNRDSYIHLNNGGLSSSHTRFDLNLRGGVHNPGQVILLPSYGSTTIATARSSNHVSLAASAVQAAARTDPKMRTLRKHQREVATYLHTAGSRAHRPTPPPVQQFAQIPAWPPASARLGYNPNSGSMSARAAPVSARARQANRTVRSLGASSNPYQAPLSSTWTAGVPIAAAQPYVEPIDISRSNFAETIPLSLQTPEQLAYAPSLDGGLLKPTPPQPQQAPQSYSPQPPQSARAQGQFQRTVEQKWVAPTSPSFYTTLPKNSSYLDSACTFRPGANYNDYEPAGFSISAKLAAKGIVENQVPLLG